MKRLSTGFIRSWMGRSILLAFLIASHAQAQWSVDTLVNIPVAVATNGQFGQRMVSDGSGGTIVAWIDSRGIAGPDIYAQRIDGAGIAQWGTNGIAICTASGGQANLAITSDGQGGAVIVWRDTRSSQYDLYAQKVNAWGSTQWTADGVAVCVSSAWKDDARIVTDGSGGAIIVWEDNRSGTYDIYAQHLNASGTLLWPAGGAAICASPASNQRYPRCVPDGLGGAIVTWEDHRFGDSDIDIYAQRINASGTVQWAVNGISICSSPNNQTSPEIIESGSSYAIIGWMDARTTPNAIYAQRIDYSGTLSWNSNGIPVFSFLNGPTLFQIVSDGAWGAIFAWQALYTTTQQIGVQRVNTSGAKQWATDGVVLASGGISDNLKFAMASDGAGGAILSYQRVTGTANLYAVRVSASGAAGQSVTISSTIGDQKNPQIVRDGTSGSIITWEDTRGGIFDDLYAQNLDASNHLGMPPTLVDVRDVPNDQGGHVEVVWNHSHLDGTLDPMIDWYEIFRGVTATGASLNYPVLDEKTYLEQKAHGAALSGTYMTNGAVTGLGELLYWEFIQNVSARKLEHYSAVVPTPADSGPQGTSKYYYMVRAYQSWLSYWDSKTDSASSIDNLPPIGVGSLAAELQPNASVKVHWPANTVDADIGEYVIYHSPSPGFTPGDATCGGTCADTIFYDLAPPEAFTAYYRLAVRDVHGNLSTPSPEASASLGATCARSLQQNWNMISVPLLMPNYAKTALFPTASSNAFAYSGGYITQPTLANGTGYWLKFSGPQPYTMTGAQRIRDTIDLVPGWNMIGSLSSAIAVNTIQQIPSGCVTSFYFGYGGSGYSAAASIEPVSGYWVKSGSGGKIVLAKAMPKLSGADPLAALEELEKLTFTDAEGRTTALYFGTKSALDPAFYELPPLPGSDAFDIRFETGRMAAIGETETGIRCTSVKYPLVVKWHAVAARSAALVADGKEYSLMSEGSHTLHRPAERLLLRMEGTPLPSAYALDQNFPNPFNPSTVIRYALPVPSSVRLDIYNALGEHVATLAEGTQSAGYKSVTFTAAGLASGVYFYRLEAGSFIRTRKLIVMH